MYAMKSVAVAMLLGLPLTALSVGVAQCQSETKPAPDAKAAAPTKAATPDAKPAATETVKSDDKAGEKKFTSSQIKAFLSKCSDEAEAKGLTIKAGKGEARKEYRRECMRKLGVNAKKE